MLPPLLALMHACETADWTAAKLRLRVERNHVLRGARSRAGGAVRAEKDRPMRAASSRRPQAVA